MDEEEQSIVEEYASSLEDLTFNSKPLINVLTMLAEENSRYASSVTKLIEERIYKVCGLFKIPNNNILIVNNSVCEVLSLYRYFCHENHHVEHSYKLQSRQN